MGPVARFEDSEIVGLILGAVNPSMIGAAEHRLSD
jgi:hypothetical protein